MPFEGRRGSYVGGQALRAEVSSYERLIKRVEDILVIARHLTRAVAAREHAVSWFP